MTQQIMPDGKAFSPQTTLSENIAIDVVEIPVVDPSVLSQPTPPQTGIAVITVAGNENFSSRDPADYETVEYAGVDVGETLYEEGEHEDDWVAGYSTGTGSQSKEADHLYLAASGTEMAPGQRTYAKDAIVDLTNVNKIFIDWAATLTGDYPSAQLIVSTEKMSSSATYDARLQKDTTFTREVEELDVSGLSGNYYIRVHALGVGSSAEVQIYGIYLDDGANQLTGVTRQVEGTARAWDAGSHIACMFSYEQYKRLKENLISHLSDYENYSRWGAL